MKEVYISNCFIEKAFFVIAGYGVIAERLFKKSDFILEYRGDLIDSQEAAQRESRYENEDVGCFMYYFVHCGKTMWLVCSQHI